jgi:hypothetical protein
MLSTQLQIVALQEISWKGHGQLKKNKILCVTVASNKEQNSLELALS